MIMVRSWFGHGIVMVWLIFLIAFVAVFVFVVWFILLDVEVEDDKLALFEIILFCVWSGGMTVWALFIKT